MHGDVQRQHHGDSFTGHEHAKENFLMTTDLRRWMLRVLARKSA